MMEQNRRLLCLDDESDILDAYREILTPQPKGPKIVSSRAMPKGDSGRPSATFDVTFVSSGEEALEAISHAVNDGKPFAGGFFDVRLGPGIDGIETINRAKVIDTNMLFVIVTAYQDRKIEDIVKVLGKEFSDRWDFQDKPFAEMVIQQKAFNLVANWNTRMREKAYLRMLNQRHEEEQIFRNVLQDVFGMVGKHVKIALDAKPDSKIGEALKIALEEVLKAEQVLADFMKSNQSAAA